MRVWRASRLAAAAVAVSLGGLLPAVAVATGADAGVAGVSAATNPASQVQVDVTDLTPRAPHPGQVLQVAGTVTNKGATALGNVNVQLRLSTTPVEGRAELADLASSTSRPPGDPVASAPLDQPLAPGASAPFTLGLGVDQLRLGGPGVYPIAVEVFADDPTSGVRTRFGVARTFLPWDMAGTKATRIAVVWPVSAGPTRGPDGVPISTRLHDQLTGRLAAVLTAASGTDVTWLLDGDTLESASALSTGAPQASAAGASPTQTTAPPDPAATAWLAQLRSLTAGRPVLALPYADPDVVAVVRAGLSDDLDLAASLGTDVTADVLGRTATGTVQPISWPAEGTADRASLTAIQQTGTTQVLLSDTYADPVRSTTYTPSGIGPLSGTGLTAVTDDATLSRLLSTPAAQAGGVVLGEQRLLAETAMIGLELPSVSRALVVVPPRGWTPDASYVHDLLHVLDTAPWVHVAQLTALTVGAADGPSRQRPTYTAGVRSREVSAAQLADVRDGHQRLAALTEVLDGNVYVTDTYTRALLRAESSVWRADRAGGRAYAASVVRQLSSLQEQVHLLPSGPVTLAARSGRIPVTIVNNLDQPVRVRVGVTAVPAVRMTLTQPAAVVLGPHSSTTLDVAANATTNGSVQVVAQLLTPGGQQFGPPQTFAVQVTGFGAVAALLVAVALVLLSVALVVRVVRAIRSGRRRPGSPASVRAPAR